MLLGMIESEYTRYFCLSVSPSTCDNSVSVYSAPEINGNRKSCVEEKAAPLVDTDPPIFTPPDGGYGWLVCFASFWVNGTVFGMLNTFGVLLPYFSEGVEGENVTTRVCKSY